MFVGEGDPAALERWARRAMDVARRCFRVDANLRPQGRDGPLVRTVASYEAYWDRWAEPWEFQALAQGPRRRRRRRARRPVRRQRRPPPVGPHAFSADDLRSLRHMKARAEAELARKGLTDREVKRGRGGIRDIEFAVQLLQLVHGRLDPDLRSPTTLDGARPAGRCRATSTATTPASWPRPTASSAGSSTSSSSTTAPRCTPCRPTSPLAPRIARTLGYRDSAAGRRRGPARRGSWRATRRPCARSTSASTSGRCWRRSPAPTPTSWPSPGAVEARLARLRLLRRRPDPRGGGRPDPRPHPVVAPDAADAAAACSAGWPRRPTPTSACSASATWSTTATGPTSCPARSATRPRRPGACARSSARAGSRPTSSSATSTSSPACPTPEKLAHAAEGRAGRGGRPTLSSGARARPGASRPPCCAGRTATCSASSPADVLGARRRGRTWATTSRAIAEAALEVALAGASTPTVPFAVIALGRFGGGELSYASDLDIVFVFEGAARRRPRRGPAGGRPSCGGSCRAPRRRRGSGRSTSTCGPRASRACWPARSTATAPTSTDGPWCGSARP